MPNFKAEPLTRFRFFVPVMTQPERYPGQLQWFASVDEGKQLELLAGSGDAPPLARIIADEKDESLWFEFYRDERCIQVPLAFIKQAAEAATRDVHSESWYEKNVYPQFEQTDAEPDEAS